MIDRRVLSINELTDEELLLIALGGRIEDEMKLIPSTSKD